MKKAIIAIALSALIWGCRDNVSVKKDDFTGNQSVYALQAASTYNTSGTVTFKERKDGTALVEVQLSGTEGNAQHPVHLHLGDLSVDGATVAALLNPVAGSTGKSETHLTNLADESAVTYKQLIALNACVKIHLSDSGPNQNIVLAAGNIGTAVAKNTSSGRLGIAPCKSKI